MRSRDKFPILFRIISMVHALVNWVVCIQDYFVIPPCIQRSVAKVKWSVGGPANIYRMGHKGKVMSSQVVQCMRTTHTTSLTYAMLCA